MPRPRRDRLAALVLLFGACCSSWVRGVGGRAVKEIRYLEDERFPGWKGEVGTIKQLVKEAEELREDLSLDTHGVHAISHHHMHYGGDDGKESYSGEVYHLSDSPRVYLYKNFLSQEECQYLIEHSKSHLQASTVVDNKTGRPVPSEVRTSWGSSFNRNANPVVSAIEKRIAEVSMIPEENQEPMQILRYEHGQKYKEHQDYFHDSVNADESRGGQRVMTVLMYLATVHDGAGGETVFPSVRMKGDTRDPKVWSECALKGLAVKATAGDMVMFYSIKPDGKLDAKSLHGSCPTWGEEGVQKWSATKWIRAGPFGGRRAKPKKTGCYDEEFMCQEWAKKGECEKNAGFMHESCKKSCKICTPAAATS